MASPSSPKDKFVVNFMNPYLTEVRKHPEVLNVEDGVLHKEDLEVPVEEGSNEERLKEMEQEVFKFKKMVERGVGANFDIISELQTLYLEVLRETWSSVIELEEKAIELQGQIYDLSNQSCEYELRFEHLSASAGSRALATEASVKTGGPPPWKDFIKNYWINIHKEQAQWE